MMSDIYNDYHDLRVDHDKLFDKCKELQAMLVADMDVIKQLQANIIGWMDLWEVKNKRIEYLEKEYRVLEEAYTGALIVINGPETVEEENDMSDLIERLRTNAKDCGRFIEDEAADLLQQYGDALVRLGGRIERLAFEIPAPNLVTPQLVQLAIELRHLAQTTVEGE